ncbi:MAG: translation initiation factor IF-2 [Anaerolineaceae bacterium]|nr:translation initiation factor IF-2 [Anaerolineaceae bacterium]
MAEELQAVLVPDYVTVRELSDLIDASPIDVMKKLIANGIMASINQQIDFDTASIVLEELGYEAQSATAAAQEEEKERRQEELAKKWEQIYAGEKPEELVKRPPVVTILGHVDHGKTTLLDAVRSAHVAEGEAGGITQHIGAYRVKHGDRYISFLDTPGHEAFTAMRARGAQGADIAVLVVAADDGVMPTTREALAHARAANVPILVAITKVDKANAGIEIVKQQLAELDLVPDDWDGDTLMVPVAALQHEGIDDLLEAILLVADDNDFVANPKGTPKGIVIEAEVDKFRGTLATLLVLNGTLKVGDSVVAGTSYGRIKAMFDEYGSTVKEAGPSVPVSILGLNEPPQPGDRFECVKNDKVARSIAVERLEERAALADTGGGRALSLEEIFSQFQAGQAKSLNLVIKVDVLGSLQPIVDSLEELSGKNEEGITIDILSAEVGEVTESDIMLASASDAIVIGFNVDVGNAAKAQANVHGVDVRRYQVIYKLLEDIEMALLGMLEPKYEDRVIGVAEVRQTFKIGRGTIAGCYIKEGEARRNAKVRVVRNDSIIVNETRVASLKRFEEDVREVRTGFECGVSLDGFNDFQEGDLIEFFVVEKVTA